VIAVLGARPFVATERGLYGSGPVGFEPLFTRAPVRDLATGPGTLLFATDAGLFEWNERDRSVTARRLGPGAEVRAVAVGPAGTAWAATGGGLFVRPPGASDFAGVRDLPVADVRAVRTAGPEVWVSTPGTLWVRRKGGGFTVILRGVPEGWLPLVDAVRHSGRTLLAVPSGLWSVDGDHLSPIDPGLGPLRALAVLDAELWVGTDRGVFSVELTDDSREAAGVPATHLWIASRRGLLTLSPFRKPGARAAEPGGFRRSGVEQSEVAAMHRAVLAYLGLSPFRLRDLERRTRRAGLWPEVRATLATARDRSRRLDRDQAVSGGNLWSLHDAESSRDRELEFQVQLSWDLARLRGPTDALAVSRERREVVELVERILDRVNRAYFERERVLSRLGQLPHESGEERDALLLKASELTATLQGLTGGAFGRTATPRREASP
jgi:hypothetical protein